MAELLKYILSTRDDESEINFADGSGLELSHLYCHITPGTLVPSSVNGDIAIQLEWPKFDPSQNPQPLTDYGGTLQE